MRHDMRHHFTMIDGFVQNRQYDKLSDYVSDYRASSPEWEAAEYCPIDVINILSHHYDTLAKKNIIHLDRRCDMSAGEGGQGYVNMSDADLCCLYSNLMENAVDACLRVKTGTRAIRVAVVRPDPESLTIRIWNTTDGGVLVDGNSFLSSKAEGRNGYGLLSIQSVAEKYGGKASFRWDKAERTFESSVTLTA